MTLKRNPANERIKRRYLQFLSDVKGRDEASLDAAAKAMERFDEYNRRRDFKNLKRLAHSLDSNQELVLASAKTGRQWPMLIGSEIWF
ncbi:MAG TPA: hypothetical protein VL996_11685 [Methylocella sp.]|nr:hypothetical protein [Methylocella sp.]